MGNIKLNKRELSSNEKIIISILSGIPGKVWIKYSDLFSLSSIMIHEFQVTIQSLIDDNFITIKDMGQGLSISLVENNP